MAIKRNFGGATIRKPGAYSQSKVSPDAGTATISTDTIFIYGEADAGPGGADEGIQTFSAAGFSQLVAKYRSGPIVDAAKAALIPSKSNGIGGAGRFLIFKTNKSTQASLAIAQAYGTLKAREYGIGGNRITASVSLAAEVQGQIQGSADITNFAGLDAKTLVIRVNGGNQQTITFATPTNISDVVTQINNSLTGAVASNSGDTLIISQSAIADHHRDGWSQHLEIAGGTALADLKLTAGQKAVPVSEDQATITIIQTRDNQKETATVGGDIWLEIGRDTSGSAASANVTIDATSIQLNAPGDTSYTLAKSDFPTISKLVDKINSLAGWSASAPATLNNKSVNDLDEVSSVGAMSDNNLKPARIKADSAAVQQFFNDSQLVELDSPKEIGLPDALTTSNLTGGLRGASASSDFDAALTAVLAEDVNVLVPAVSQDASDDAAAGLTDPASTYDIETIHAQLDTHLRLRGSIKNKKEAQGVVGYRKKQKSAVYEQAATIQSSLIQLWMQDVLVLDALTNELKWKQPHVGAALLAGMRVGSSIGEPLTFKFLNVSGIGHYVNPDSGKEEGDFNPLVDYDEAIDQGVTFAEPASGGFRVVVDNTTYGIDESFVFNRGSVVEASHFIAKTIRTDAELAFVGRKNSEVTASDIKSRIQTRLNELFDDKILSPSDDAPLGYVEETFVVTVEGNTANVQVEVKPVQALDLILITFILGDTKQSA